jgi:hypothetical protein
MMSNSILVEMMIKERQKSYEDELKRAMLISKLKKNRPALISVFIESIANGLIKMGEYLKRKYGKKTALEMSGNVCSCT